MPEKWLGFRISMATFLGALVLFTFLMMRTGGIDADENNYLFLAKNSLIGTVQLDGKPPFYYFVNYLLYHSVSFLLGKFKGISLYLFYLPFCSFSLAFLSHCVCTDSAKRWTLFFLLLLHPLSLIGGTQVLMETPLLALLNLLFGLLFLLGNRGAKVRSNRFLLFLIFFTSVLIFSVKVTGIAAIPLLAIPFFGAYAKKIFPPIFLGLFTGYIATKFSLIFFHAPPLVYSDIGAFMSVSHLLGAAKIWWTQLQLWIFYVSPFLVIAALLVWRSNRQKGSRLREQEKRKGLLLLLAGTLSLAASLFLVFFTNYEAGLNAPRYHFPIFWAGVLCFSILIANFKPWVSILSILLTIPISGAYISEKENRFQFWPDTAYIRSQGYDLHTFIGFPIWRWYLWHGGSVANICVYLPEKNQVNAALWAKKFLVTALESPQFFNEKNREQFEQCTAPKAIYSNQLEFSNPNCMKECVGIDASWRSCQWQTVEGYKFSGAGVLGQGDGKSQTDRTRQQVAICFP